MSRPETLSGRRVVVTGANSGIGRQTARALARAGAEVILVCRDPGRGDEALNSIREENGNQTTALMQCDLSSQASIRQFCGAFRERYEHLDVLVNNAGGYFAERGTSVDGLELTFALNHMGYFLMARGLGPSLRASTAARVVNVGSLVHRAGHLDFEDLQWQRRRYMGLRTYCDSKLMNVLFTKALSNRLAGVGITANCLHPGAIRSGFAARETGWFGGLVRMGSWVLTSAETGAKTSIYLASEPKVADVTGHYFVNCRPRRPSRAARNVRLSERLWAASEALIEIDPLD